MRRLIIDCNGKEEVWQELTPVEETVRLAEIQAAKNEVNNQRIKEKHRAFLRVSLELREMRQNRDVFSDINIAEKQAELDGLRG